MNFLGGLKDKFERIIMRGEKYFKNILWENLVNAQQVRTIFDDPYLDFKNILWENSEDFLMLERLVEESNWEISWKKLWKYTKIENGVVEWIYWEEELYLKWTRVKSLGKVKKAKIIYLYWVESLEDLWELEEVRNLDLRWTSKELQIQAIEKIKEWKLKVGEISLWGNIDWIEEVLEKLEWFPEDIDLYLYLRWTKIKSLGRVKKANFIDLYWVESLEDLWDLEEVKKLDLRWTSIGVQIQAIEKIKKWKLKVKKFYNLYNLYIDYEFIGDIVWEDWEINFDKFRKRFGDSIKDIEDEKIKIDIQKTLLMEQERKKEESVEEIKKIINNKELKVEEKKKIISKINEEYELFVWEIKGYLGE
jgi:hypothetical protein